MDPKEVVRRLYCDVYGRGRTDLIDELCADEFVDHDAFSGEIGKADVAADVAMYRCAMPDLRIEVLDVFADGHQPTGHMVTLRWRATGTHTGPLVSMPATNRRISIEGITIVRVQDDKAREAWTQADFLALLRQIAVVPEMPRLQKSRGRSSPPGALTH